MGEEMTPVSFKYQFIFKSWGGGWLTQADVERILVGAFKKEGFSYDVVVTVSQGTPLERLVILEKK